MAREDGTYYETLLSNGRIPETRIHGLRNPAIVYGHSFAYELVGGSGTATLYVIADIIANATYDSAVDITREVLRSSSSVASAGETKKVLILDAKGRLRGFRFVWIKVVLDTGGANDADFNQVGNITWRL